MGVMGLILGLWHYYCGVIHACTVICGVMGVMGVIYIKRVRVKDKSESNSSEY